MGVQGVQGVKRGIGNDFHRTFASRCEEGGGRRRGRNMVGEGCCICLDRLRMWLEDCIN